MAFALAVSIVLNVLLLVRYFEFFRAWRRERERRRIAEVTRDALLSDHAVAIQQKIASDLAKDLKDLPRGE